MHVMAGITIMSGRVGKLIGVAVGTFWSEPAVYPPIITPKHTEYQAFDKLSFLSSFLEVDSHIQ